MTNEDPGDVDNFDHPDDLLGTLHSLDDQVRRLVAELATAKDRAAEAERLLGAANQALDLMETENLQLRQESDAWESRAMRARTQRDQCQQWLEAAEKREQELQAERDRFRNGRDYLQSLIAQANEKNKQAVADE